MTFIQINIEGSNELNAYLNGMKRRLKTESDVLPRKLAFSVRRGIRQALLNKRYDGNYRKFTGAGLHESLRVSKIGLNFYEVQPDPAQSSMAYPGGRSTILAPWQYAGIIEPKQKYFAKGFRIGVQNANKDVQASANKIIGR